MKPALPLPRLTQDFREWALMVFAHDPDSNYGMMVNAAVENDWKGASTRSLKTHLWRREYRGSDYRAFRHMQDIWEKWLGFREVLLRDGDLYE